MSKISTIILIDQIPKEGIQKCLDLVESIVEFSKGKPLTRENTDQITKKLGSLVSGTRLYPGGSSVLFGWSFYFEDIGHIIIKPYYRREITALFIHYFTLQDFTPYLDEIQLKIQSSRIKITIPKVIGFAKIRTLAVEYPVLLTSEVLGDSIHKKSSLIALTSKLAKKVGNKGIIMDPYPSNWKYTVKNGEIIIAYIDLLSSNLIKNLENRISELIKNYE
ncbi:MAG: hypothetical protein ACFFAU_06170 [Candidatus Hodarchaeota archaeon]